MLDERPDREFVRFACPLSFVYLAHPFSLVWSIDHLYLFSFSTNALYMACLASPPNGTLSS
jgi:hypothetical protein